MIASIFLIFWLSIKVDLNHRDFDGNTPLMYMVDEGLRIEDRTLKAYFIKKVTKFSKI